MNLPPFPTDESTLDLLWTALNPGPESERTSLFDLLELMSELGGSDTSAVSEVIPGNPLGLDIDGAEIHVMRDAVYSDHDVIRALIVALREERQKRGPS